MYYDLVVPFTALGVGMSDFNAKTTFLVPQSSFLTGAARVLDLFATFSQYNRSPSPEEADARAFASDWGMTFRDFVAARDQIRQRARAAR